MKRKVCLVVLTLALLASSFPMLAFAVSPEDAAAWRTARAEALHMLADYREPEAILVFMEDDVTPEEAEALFISLGILESLEDREICRYRSDLDGFGSRLWFVLLIPEDRIVDRLTELNLSELVNDACPNFITFLDEEYYSLGDVDRDGNLTPYDYMLVKRAVLGTYHLEGDAALLADMDQNGELNAIDYMKVKRAVLGTYEPDWINLFKWPVNTTWGVNQYISLSDEELYEKIDQELAADEEGLTTLTISFAHIKEETDGAALLKELGFSGDLSDETAYPVVRHEGHSFLVVVMELPAERLRDAMFTLRRCEEILSCDLGTVIYPA